MTTEPHPRFHAIRREIQKHRETARQRAEGRFFRCATPQFASPEALLNGQGTRRYGGRWMPPGEERAVSRASTDLLAVKEARGKQEGFQMPPSKARAYMLVPIWVNLAKVCNLAKLPEDETWLKWAELLGEDWASLNDTGKECLSQAVGRATFSLGFEGLIARSARDHRARTLTFSPENLSNDSTVKIEDAVELNRWLRPD